METIQIIQLMQNACFLRGYFGVFFLLFRVVLYYQLLIGTLNIKSLVSFLRQKKKKKKDYSHTATFCWLRSGLSRTEHGERWQSTASQRSLHSLCLPVCVYVRVCECMHTRVHTHVHMWRLAVSVRCLPLSLVTSFFLTESLTETGVH